MVIYVLTSEYLEMISTEEGGATTAKHNEVNAVFYEKEDAEKFGEYLLNNEDTDKRYISYKINSFCVL